MCHVRRSSIYSCATLRSLALHVLHLSVELAGQRLLVTPPLPPPRGLASNKLVAVACSVPSSSLLASPMAATNTTPTTLSMKLLIDRKAQRLLFAEASKDVVDFLFSLLVLPVGAAVRLLGKEGVAGSVGSLYGSVEGLDYTYIQPGAAKDALLRPAVLCSLDGSSLLRLLPAPPLSSVASSRSPLMLYRCTSIFNSSCRTYITDAYGKACPTCGNHMTAAAQYLPPAGHTAAAAATGFVRGVVTYTVMDNLTVMPMSAISSFTLLNAFAVTDLAALQEKTVQLGYNEGLEILRASLQSKTVLSDVFLRRKGLGDDA